MIDIEILKERIRLKYDADEVVDLLNIEVGELLEAFPDKLVEYRENFVSEEYFE